MVSQEQSRIWDPFVEARAIAEILASGEATEDMPTAVSAGLRFLSAYEISNYWKEIIEDDRKFPALSHLIDTYNLLIDGGFKETNASCCVIILLAACIGYSRDQNPLLNPQRDHILCSTAKAMLAGFIGAPDQDMIEWVLILGNRDSDENAAMLLKLINDSAKGSEPAQRELVSVIVPFWKELVSNWTAGNVEENTQSLGFPFRYAEVLSDHPDFMAWRAYVFYVFGASGDETQARELAAKAAFLGSREAWNLIKAWSFESGDIKRVMETIIAVGISSFCDDLRDYGDVHLTAISANEA